MVWLQVDDIELMRHPEMIEDAIRKNTKYKEIDTSFLEYPVIIEPSNKKIRKIVKKGEHVVVLSFNAPYQNRVFRNSNNHPFLHIKLRNPHFPAKLIEYNARIPTEVILSERLGFKMVEPKYGMEKVAGVFRLKAYIDKIHYLHEAGLPVSLRALMFFGTAGSGKTHVAQAIAHKFGYKFGYLDLPHFMTLPSPTQALDELFDFLEEQDEKCVLLIDEIEKMFDFTGQDIKSKNVFGKLLTRLNDIYNDPNSKIIFIATANNISQISKNSPEFLRKGRFDEVFFLSYPNEESAKAVIQLFINDVGAGTEEMFSALLQAKKMRPQTQKLFDAIEAGHISMSELVEKLSIRLLPADMLYETINIAYPDAIKASDSDEFVYAPPEIATVVKELQKEAVYQFLLEAENTPLEKIKDMPSTIEMLTDNNEEMIERVVKGISPLQIYASEGIKEQIAQAENYTANSGDYTQYRKG